MKSNTKNMIFSAKVKVGDKWEYQGTVVIRANMKGGVLYLITGEKDANGKAKQKEIALFPKREKAESAMALAPVPNPE